MEWVVIWACLAARCSCIPPLPSFLYYVFSLKSVPSIGRIIGTGIFSTPSSILGSVGSVGASLLLWVAGFLLSFCGLFIWLEFGTMFPRSGGEKVYLEAVYRRPKYLSTAIFAANAIILGFTSANCIVSSRYPIITCRLSRDYHRSLRRSRYKLSPQTITSDVYPKSILVSAGRSAHTWVVRGIALGGTQPPFSS